MSWSNTLLAVQGSTFRTPVSWLTVRKLSSEELITFERNLGFLCYAVLSCLAKQSKINYEMR